MKAKTKKDVGYLLVVLGVGLLIISAGQPRPPVDSTDPRAVAAEWGSLLAPIVLLGTIVLGTWLIRRGRADLRRGTG